MHGRGDLKTRPSALETLDGLAIDMVPVPMWTAHPDGALRSANQHWQTYTGFAPHQLSEPSWLAAEIIHPDDRPGLAALWAAALRSGQAADAEARVRRFDGVYRWFLLRAVPIHDERGAVLKWFGTHLDVDDDKHARLLVTGANHVFEQIAQAAPLAAILDRLCRLVEQIDCGTLAAVLLLDRAANQLRPAAAPSLPDELVSALGGDAGEPHKGPCATAVLRNETVIVADIAGDPRWADFRELPLRHGLHACWSIPIRTCSTDVVLGTFIIFAREPRMPTARHHEMMEQITHITGLAIDRTRTLAALTESEERFRYLADSIAEVIWITAVNPERVLYTSPSFERIWGLPVDELYRNPRLWTDQIHPQDRERVTQAFARWIAGEEAAYEDVEYRIVRPDGTTRWILERGVRSIDASGRASRVSGISTDITERKLAEERMRGENLALREEIDKASMFEEIVGASPALQVVLSRVAKVAPTDSTVLISGETGTGKELIARAIHKRSQRSQRAFISVNCAAIPPSLISSELFGHEKGAFTGALQRRLGRFELADGGTLFLDEVGELPQETQIALLRVLQERAFERVGGNEAIRTDVRVIAATNRDLHGAIAAGTFRSDLFYRLNVFPLELPPLRERGDDIPMLVRYFIDRYGGEVGKRIRDVSPETMKLLQSYRWPGNIRELQNVVERSVILSDSDVLAVDESWLPRDSAPTASAGGVLADVLSMQESAMIEAALAESRGRVAGPAGAAAKLGMRPSTLESKIRSLKIDKHRFKRA